MAATPETLRPEVAPQIQERQEQFIVPENLQSSGVKAVQKTFTAQVKDDKGQAVIQTPPTQVVSVSPPYDQTTLTTQAKGSVTSSITWLSAFWLRVLKKALHFGWKIVGVEPPTPQVKQ